MHNVRLGTTNLMVSRVGLGAMGLGSANWRPWVQEKGSAHRIVTKALELGVNFFDTCDYYSAGESERLLGSILWSVVNREEVVIATKVGNPMGPGPNGRGYSRKHILSAVEASLQRLSTDYIDLYQTHIWDTQANVEEVVTAFDDLVRAGKVHYVGMTDVPAWQFAKAVYFARHHGMAAPVSAQFHYNLVWRGAERELLPFCEAEGIGLVPYSPLARGFLSSAAGHARDTERARADGFAQELYGRGEDERVRAAVHKVASERNVSAAAVALAWVLVRCPNAAPLLGVTDARQLEVIGEALTLELLPGELDDLEKEYLPRASYAH